MREFVIPDDGLFVRTDQGRPVLELSIHAEGTVVRMFGADGEPKLALATQGDGGALLIGDPERNSVVISVTEDVSEIRIMNSGKTVALAIDDTHSELRFVNANNAITNKIYVDDDGGQIGLGDQEGNVLLSAGAEERGGACHLMNKKGNTVVLLQSTEANGNITLMDEDGDIRAMILPKDDGNIHLVDKAGHIVWTTMRDGA